MYLATPAIPSILRAKTHMQLRHWKSEVHAPEPTPSFAYGHQFWSRFPKSIFSSQRFFWDTRGFPRDFLKRPVEFTLARSAAMAPVGPPVQTQAPETREQKARPGVSQQSLLQKGCKCHTAVGGGISDASTRTEQLDLMASCLNFVSRMVNGLAVWHRQMGLQVLTICTVFYLWLFSDPIYHCSIFFKI